MSVSSVSVLPLTLTTLTLGAKRLGLGGCRLGLTRLKTNHQLLVMNEIAVPSALIAPRADKPLAPAMITALWEIAAVLDEQRIPATVENAVWLEIPTRRLRGEEGRNDNVWLRQCLERLTGVKLSGEHRGDPWGAVMVAQWHITQGGSVARILVPPAAIQALRAPSTFAKIETTAAHRLNGSARRLYAILADKKRLGRPTWTFSLDELRSLLDLTGKPAYGRWNNLRQWVLGPAVAAINDFGTVEVTMTPVKLGRAVNSVRFDWRWKSVDEARITDEENARHSMARGQEPTAFPAAPPLIDEGKRIIDGPSADEKAQVVAEMKDLMGSLGGKRR